MPLTKNIVIRRGSTFVLPVRWEALPIVYRPITAITNTAPVAITCAGHGVPNGWRVAIVSVQGMTEINAKKSPPKTADYHVATVSGSDTLSLNDVNASEYEAYTGGGYVQYYTPVDLTGYTARMQIKDAVGGTVLASFTTVAGIAIDTAAHKIAVTISATDTAGYTWDTGVYDLELVSPLGVVEALLTGTVTINSEVTT